MYVRGSTIEVIDTRREAKVSSFRLNPSLGFSISFSISKNVFCFDDAKLRTLKSLKPYSAL